MKNNKQIIVKVILMLLLGIFVMPIKTNAEEIDLRIANIDIEGVKFNYNAGDKPVASAYTNDPWDELYDIDYEYWEEMETNDSGELVPVKFWYSDENKNNALTEDKKIVTFLEGKTYMYSIYLKAKGDNKFSDKTTVRVNMEKANNIKVFNPGLVLFVPAVKTIKPTKPVLLKHIDVIELNNATINFNANDKPVFTGKTPNDAPYIYQFEGWHAKDGAGITSAEFFNQGYEKLITTFENGKEYQYILYFKAKEGYAFTRKTKLKINGKYYNYKVSDWEEETSVDEFQTTWRMYPDLIMSPISNKNEIKSTGKINGSIIFENKLDKDYTLDINQIEIKKELSDKNIKYLVDINLLENGQIIKINNTKMKIKIALPEDLKGYKKYEVVYIKDNQIKETIEAKVENESIVFETSHLSEYGIVATEKISNNDVVIPKTSDNVILYLLSGTISLMILVGGIYKSKKMS